MNVEYGMVNRLIKLRGQRFPPGTLIKLWHVGDVISIQPVVVPTEYHKALWYSMPTAYSKNITPLDDSECNGVRFLYE
jgi:hypothetical protein